MNSPAWYRGRSAVFALIYAVGFLGGWAVSAALGRPYIPAFRELGEHWGSKGVTIAVTGALLCMAAAFAIRVWGSSYLSAFTVWNANARTDALLVAGPFRYCRHPLYAANLLLALGMGAAAPLYGWAFIVFANLFFVYALLVHEERALAQRHDEAYARYRNAVPALFPRLVPVPALQTKVRPSLAQGFRAECFSGFVILGMMGFFIVPSYGGWILAASYILGVIVQRNVERATN